MIADIRFHATADTSAATERDNGDLVFCGILVNSLAAAKTECNTRPFR